MSSVRGYGILLLMILGLSACGGEPELAPSARPVLIVHPGEAFLGKQPLGCFQDRRALAQVLGPAGAGKLGSGGFGAIGGGGLADHGSILD